MKRANWKKTKTKKAKTEKTFTQLLQHKRMSHKTSFFLLFSLFCVEVSEWSKTLFHRWHYHPFSTGPMGPCSIKMKKENSNVHLTKKTLRIRAGNGSKFWTGHSTLTHDHYYSTDTLQHVSILAAYCSHYRQRDSFDLYYTDFNIYCLVNLAKETDKLWG